MSTMRDVAAHAGVGLKTVSRVFNDDPHVDPVTRRKVQRSLRALNYVPNALAQAFRTGKDPAIGVVVPDLSDPFFAAAVAAIESRAVPRGISVVIAASGTGPERERSTVTSLLNRQVMGLIATPVGDDQSYLKSWQERTPVVFIDRMPKGITADTFVEDDVAGAALATRHLLSFGHRRVAFIGDDLSVWTTRRRLEGYKSAMAEAHAAVDPGLISIGPWTEQTSLAAVRALLGQDRPPTALFSSNARCSITLIPALQALGKPGTALVGFGDFPLAGALKPPLSVIDQDPRRLGELAAERVFARMEGPPKRLRRHNVLPLRLIERGSGELAP